ncbi:MAG TPA: hypothetical protein VGN78_01120 [Solirubrobacteraceae bacterium]|nr:hypothetical protein [Solirubrobacteraceae bacterium]
MRSQRGQSTVEWTGLLLLVAAAFSALAMAAHAVGDGGLPERLACAIAGRECGPTRVFTAADFRPLRGMRAVVGVRETGPTGLLGSVPSALGGVATAVPAASILGGAGGFVWRHRRTVRKVAVVVAIGAGVGATCAAAIAAANAVGAVGCGSAIVIGGFTAYDNATR